MSISLQKRNETFGLSLKKKNISKILACVSTALDISGSMTSNYRNGTMQEFVERLIPLGLRFDDNGEIDNWIFNNGCKKTETLTAENYAGYVASQITPKVNGGTSFAPVLREIYDFYFKEVKGGWLSKGKPAVAGDKPVYLLFQTDGDNDDEQESMEIMKEIEAKGMYIQFVGVGNGTNFRFIKAMGDEFNNVGFFHVPDVARMSDDQLYDLIINDEFKEFMQARFPQYIQ